MKHAKRDPAFTAGLVLTILATAANFISFVSPYWIQSKPNAQSLFLNIGLWTACFTGYMLPNRYDKAYFGCWYIYYIEYDDIRAWINPAWLYAMQVLTSLGMLTHTTLCYVMICMACQTIQWDSLKFLRLIILGHFFTGLTNICAIVAFTVSSYDSRWMPFPQLNMLSWGYGFAYISLILSTAALIALIVLFLRIEPQKAEQELDSAYAKGQNEQVRTGEMELLPKYRPEWRSPPNSPEDVYSQQYVNDQKRLISPTGSEIYSGQGRQDGVYLGPPPSDLSV
ncbi:hypothetical protein Ciccas_002164 [Cichlidogyrus casuarinus]|uniref:Uncharacterized protein n=1 Tax=Cichlidogyrus casuarinus TaxID=1844966 RepID=A0ABD2QI19_9PLAT